MLLGLGMWMTHTVVQVAQCPRNLPKGQVGTKIQPSYAKGTYGLTEALSGYSCPLPNPLLLFPTHTVLVQEGNDVPAQPSLKIQLTSLLIRAPIHFSVKRCLSHGDRTEGGSVGEHWKGRLREEPPGRKMCSHHSTPSTPP